MAHLFSQSTLVLLLLSLRPVSAALCASAPTCSSSPINDPSFELNDGSWIFNGGQIVPASSAFPAHTSNHLAQFTFAGLGGDEIIYSFTQTVNNLCIDSPYTFSGYYNSPQNPGGITCALEVMSGNTLLASNDINMGAPGYTQFTTTFLPSSTSAQISIAMDCTYGPTGGGVFYLDFDDFALDLATPTSSVSCSATTANSTPVTTSSSSSVISASSSDVQSSSTTGAPTLSITSVLSSQTSESSSTSLFYPNATSSYVRPSGSLSRITRTSCHKVTRSASSSTKKTCTRKRTTSSLPTTTVSAFLESTTSTIFSTVVSIITACPASVTNCPIGSIVTKTIAISTTVCPVTPSPTPIESNPKMTTSTIYATSVYTVTKCPATVTNCPVGQVVTKTIAVSTTICPIAQTEGNGPKGGASETGVSVLGGSLVLPVTSLFNLVPTASGIPGVAEPETSTTLRSAEVVGASSSVIVASVSAKASIATASGGLTTPTAVSSILTSVSGVINGSSSLGAASSTTLIAGSSESTSSAKGSATTSSTLAQFTANSAERGSVRWSGTGVILAAAGLVLL